MIFAHAQRDGSYLITDAGGATPLIIPTQTGDPRGETWEEFKERHTGNYHYTSAGWPDYDEQIRARIRRSWAEAQQAQYFHEPSEPPTTGTRIHELIEELNNYQYPDCGCDDEI